MMSPSLLRAAGIAPACRSESTCFRRRTIRKSAPAGVKKVLDPPPVFHRGRPPRVARMSEPGEERVDPRQPAAELLPEVYAELRRLAESLTVRLRPGQTIQATALVHEAFLRLVGDQDPGWEGRRHFFGAAAQAMRQI